MAADDKVKALLIFMDIFPGRLLEFNIMEGEEVRLQNPEPRNLLDNGVDMVYVRR